MRRVPFRIGIIFRNRAVWRLARWRRVSRSKAQFSHEFSSVARNALWRKEAKSPSGTAATGARTIATALEAMTRSREENRAALLQASETPISRNGPLSRSGSRPSSASAKAVAGETRRAGKGAAEAAPKPPEFTEPQAERVRRRRGNSFARRPAGPPPRRLSAPANDDFPSIGGLIFALQQRPSRTPFLVALGASIAWFLIGGFFALG